MTKPVPSTSAMRPGLLNDDHAADFLAVSTRRFHELRDEDWMPKPIVLGPRLLRWSLAELEAAIPNMPRQCDRTEPLHLLKARAARSGQTLVKGNGGVGNSPNPAPSGEL